MITDAIKDQIRTLVAAEKTPEAKTRLRESLARQHNLTLPQVRAITAWSVIRAKKAAPVMYNNPTKRAWRRHSRSFQTGLFTEFNDRIAVCMPGENWYEATEVFIPLGYKAIYGIERDPTPAFFANAEKLKDKGCVPIVGEAERVFANPQKYGLPEAVDFVSLDYLGPVHRGLMDTLNRVKMRTDVFGLAVNVMGKRENADIQEFLEIENLTTDSTYAEYCERQRNIQDHAKGISYNREVGLGVNYFCKLQDALPEMEPDIPHDLYPTFFGVLEAMGRVFESLNMGYRGTFEGILMHAISAPYRAPQVCMSKHESYWYESEDGDGSRFFTDFVGVHRKPRPDTRKLGRIRKFFHEFFDTVRGYPDLSKLLADVKVQYQDRNRGIKMGLEVQFMTRGHYLPWKSMVLPMEVIRDAVDEGEQVIGQCLSRQYYSDLYHPQRTQIVPTKEDLRP
jgi:hypothetical protein